MAQILAIATDVPPHRLSLAVTERLLREVLTRWDRPPERFVSILHNAAIEWRHSAYGEDEIIEEHSLAARSETFKRTSIELAERTARAALRQAGLTPQDIDAVVTVSCTGYMLPSLDGHLINRLEMKAHTRRLPITELGCSAGVAGLMRAWEQSRAYPGSRTLLVSVELPTLTFQPGDRRPCQLISSLIFADGAAAVVVGPGARRRGPTLLGGRTYTMPATLGEMGYDLDETGFHITLSASVPQHIRETIGVQVQQLVQDHGARLTDIRWCAMHPAGPKVLRLVEEEFDFRGDQLAPSWQVLRDYGNMSSAAVLFVLAEMLRQPPARSGDLGLIVAFGPGVSGEIMLARWNE
jgi:alkylresorcinol/alkylpyrone synthase